jgi:hypothetical protein
MEPTLKRFPKCLISIPTHPATNNALHRIQAIRALQHRHLPLTYYYYLSGITFDTLYKKMVAAALSSFNHIFVLEDPSLS